MKRALRMSLTMRPQTTNRKVNLLLSLAAVGALFAAPAAAQEYQVTVNLFNDTSIPAPTSYTFDTTTPFSSSNVAYTNLSAIFDSACNGDCSVESITYNNNLSTISYTDSQGKVYGSMWDFGVQCSVMDGSGNCLVNPTQNITSVGTYYAYGFNGLDWTDVGEIVVSKVNGSGPPSVPEYSTYFEFGFVGMGLAFFGFRRLRPQAGS